MNGKVEELAGEGGDLAGGEAGDGRRWRWRWGCWRHGGPEVAAAAACGGGGGGGGGVAMTVGKNPWLGQGVTAVIAAAAVAARRRAAVAAAVGLLPRPSLSSHLRGRSLISFFK